MTGSTDIRVRVFISWAHRYRDWTPAEKDTWRDTVIGFASALVASGVDTDIDLWHEHELGIDWTRWGQQRIEDSNHVLIAMNRAWAERWAGHNDPKEGAGAVMEADALHGLLVADQAAFQHKAIVVSLPGADGGIPPDLARLIRRRIQKVNEAGISDLVRLLTGQSQWVRPSLGAIPSLPPREAVPMKATEPPSEGQSFSAPRDLAQPGITFRTGRRAPLRRRRAHRSPTARVSSTRQTRTRVVCCSVRVERCSACLQPDRGSASSRTDEPTSVYQPRHARLAAC